MLLGHSSRDKEREIERHGWERGWESRYTTELVRVGWMDWRDQDMGVERIEKKENKKKTKKGGICEKVFHVLIGQRGNTMVCSLSCATRLVAPSSHA
jgi:hypothetical protein